MAELGEGAAFVGADDEKFGDAFALPCRDAVEAPRDVERFVNRALGVLVAAGAHVEGGAGRLRLDPGAGCAFGDRRERGAHDRQALPRVGRQSGGEAEVELGAVAPDQVDLARQTRQDGQVAQRPP